MPEFNHVSVMSQGFVHSCMVLYTLWHSWASVSTLNSLNVIFTIVQLIVLSFYVAIEKKRNMAEYRVPHILLKVMDS